MNEQDFLKKMQEEILDTEEEIKMDTLLKDIEEWDSLAYVRGAEKVEDLYELLRA